jgi:DNA-binding transcriptional LysR family regulator
MLLLAAREGTGIAFLPDHLASDDVAAGRLVRLLPDELDYSTMLYAVYPSRRHLSAKVRTFIDFLAASFAAG